MKRSQLALLKAYDVRPVKRRGQNFLIDGNMARSIAVDCLELSDAILEIGAGGGALTGPLLDGGARVVAVEVDRRLCELLRAEFGQQPGFRLLETDLTRLDWAATLSQVGDKPLIAGNLPYVLTSEVLFALAGLQGRVAGAVCMVQREVADRLVAEPGSKTFGLLSVVLRSLFTVRIVRTVPARVFWPAPEVASAVVRLVPKTPWDEIEYGRLLRVAKRLFGQRRKKVATLLRSLYNLTSAEVTRLAAEVGFDPDQRPEQLDLEVWRRLAAHLPEGEDA